jgi:hypothetical protein
MVLILRRVLFSCISVLALAMLVGCAPARGPAYYDMGFVRLYPLEKEHRSNLVIGPMGGLLPSEGSPAFAIRIDNRSTDTIWVQVVIEATDTDPQWKEVAELAGGRGTLLQSRRQRVQSDTEYPVVFSIYADRGLTRLLEEIRTKFRFSEKDLQEFRKLTGIPAGT